MKVYETLQRIRMAWFTLICTVVLFTAVLAALVCAAFSPVAGPYMRYSFGIIDGLIAMALRPVYAYLFPKVSGSK